MARRDAGGGAAPRPRRTRRSTPRAPRAAAALPARRPTVVAPIGQTPARRLPRRRYGSRQDHPADLASAGSQARAERRRREGAAREPAGGAGLAAVELGDRDRAIRPGSEGR